MLKAYVGIAKADGLVCFLPDAEPWIHLIEGHRASFWAVLADDVAEQVRGQMAVGERFRAMQVLDGMANEIRPLALGYPPTWTGPPDLLSGLNFGS